MVTMPPLAPKNVSLMAWSPKRLAHIGPLWQPQGPEWVLRPDSLISVALFLDEIWSRVSQWNALFILHCYSPMEPPW